MANITSFRINGVAEKVDYNALANLPNLAAKQDVISDLSTIRSGAAAGATALQSHQDISGKADKSDTYTKSQVDTALSAKATVTALETLDSAAVKCTAQTLSAEQKRQARVNIDIGVRLLLNSDGTVSAVEN